MNRFPLWLAMGLVIGCGSVVLAESVPDYDRDVQPILRRHCYRCHAGKNVEGGLQLDRRLAAFGVADSDETIIVPKSATTSYLLKRLTDGDYGDIMPPDAEKLSVREINTLRKWIEAGAAWPDQSAEPLHWAYQQPTRSPVPTGDGITSDNPIDAYIRRRLVGEGMSLSEPAAPEKRLRRVSLALTGLPPTPEQLDDIRANPTAANYRSHVDRLLTSKRYGEHWARPWLDLARYADSNGYQADQLRDSWAYRDWVIDAINAGMPMDQFMIEQLAGDLLPQPTVGQRIATGFHRTVTCNVEAGVHPEANRVNQVVDRVNTTGTVFLGMTLECAQCHDHKYDPVSQREYYELFAFFNNTPVEVKQDSGVQFNFYGPKMELPLSEEIAAKRESLRQRQETLTGHLEKAEAEQTAKFDAWLTQMRERAENDSPRWEVVKPIEVVTTGGEDHTVLDDQSVLFGGKVPGTTRYTIRLPLPSGTASRLRVEALTHEALPGKGPGRGDARRPNFILSEIGLSLDSTGEAIPVSLFDPQADYSQKGWEVAKSLDDNLKTGWAIGQQFGKPHHASFAFDPDQLTIGSDSGAAVLTLDQNYGSGRTIGRLRVSWRVGDAELASTPESLVSLLNKETLSKGERAKLADHHLTLSERVRTLRTQKQQADAELAKIDVPTTLVMVEMEQPRETHVLQRGDYLNPGEAVDSKTPETLHGWNKDWPRNRLGLAKWITSPENPLTARVMVNRWWGQLFGRPLVTTPEDFGTQGERPSHPELLDFLALELIESGWSMRHVHRLIVTSETFQQSSRITKTHLARDPENVLLARGPRYRLSAEVVRDNALAASGLLSTKMHGPPIMPYQPNGIWRAVGRNQPKWKAAETEDRFRRGIYVVWKRGAPYPSFVNFDAPDRAACTVARPRTNTPLQALTLLNDPSYAEIAVAFAQRMLTTPEAKTDLERLQVGFRLCTGRDADAEELSILESLLEQERQTIAERPGIAKQRLSNLPAKWRREELDAARLAVWFSVANTLLNLDETITLN